MAEKPHEPKNMKRRSRAVKVANEPIAIAETHPASPGALLSKIVSYSNSRAKKLQYGNKRSVTNSLTFAYTYGIVLTSLCTALHSEGNARSTVQTEQAMPVRVWGRAVLQAAAEYVFCISVGQCVCFTGVLFLYHFSGITLSVNEYDL